MMYILAPLAGLAVAVALAFLYHEGKVKKDDSMKWIAIVGFVAFIIIVYALGGGSDD